MIVSDIGRDDVTVKIFQEVVPKVEYRLHCLHHAAVLGTKKVLYIVAKGSSIGVGGIIFVALLQLSERLRNNYMF